MTEREEHMLARARSVSGTWTDEGDGYFSMEGFGFMSSVAYIALPEGHPDAGGDYGDLEPEVNGGLTYGQGHIFGWDYGHAWIDSSPHEDIPRALAYFRAREKQNA